MRYPREMLALTISLWVTLGGSGCPDRTGDEAKPPSAPTQLTPQPTTATERPAPEGELFRLAGSEDVTNRFPSTVVVVTESPSAPGKAQRCGGVLLARGLVLTAGHCVCGKQPLQAPGQEGRFKIDGQVCAARAIVETVFYDPPRPGKGLGSHRQEYSGKVQPHPGLEILLDREGGIVSSHADLAVILLETPVDQDIPFVELAESDVNANETITLVGYGSDERLGNLGGKRRFNETHVAADPRLEGDRMLFEQPGRQLYKGESGGPCLRQSPRGWGLVGISGRSLGKEPTCISTYPYRSWLMEHLRETDRDGAGAGR